MDCFILKDMDLNGIPEFLESHLSHNIEDYPEGIVIPIDKPYRWTSADVVRKCKFQLQKHFSQKKLKVGHAGTLDPLATGMLIVCAGKATKIAEELQAHEKEYLATVEFGATTASFDLEQPIDAYYPYQHITAEKIAAALEQFKGEQEQVPPMFSAKIIGGLRAYELARAGEEVEMRKSIINIYDIELVSFVEKNIMTDDGFELSDSVRNVRNYHTSHISDGQRPAATLRIRCSKGTYIRSLARDLGLALGSGAYLTALRRTASGPFRLKTKGFLSFI